jgi:hypothetical protein
VNRVVLTSILIMCSMLNPASANSHHRHHAIHRHFGAPVTHSWISGSGILGFRVQKAPHRPTRRSWSTGDADAVLRQSTDDALRRQQDDSNAIQQMNNNNGQCGLKTRRNEPAG